MFSIKVAIATLALAATGWSCARTPPPMVAAGPPAETAQRSVLQTSTPFVSSYHVRPGCYSTVGGNEFRFKVYENLTGGKETWDLLARTVVRSCTDTVTMPRRAPYYSIASPGVNKSMMVMWKNVTNGDYGYLAFNLGSTFWTVFTNRGRSWNYLDAPTVRWRSGGESITIAMRTSGGSPDLLTRDFKLLFTFSLTGTR